MNLDGKVVAIALAAGGIGSALARDLASRGTRLVLTDRDTAALEALANSLGAVTHAGDVADPDLPRRLLALARERFDEPDVLVNSAGIMTVGAIDELDIDKACLMIRINLEALTRFSYVFARAFKARGSGFLINISSIAGYRTQATMGVYDASKHGVEVLTDALRIELAGTGVRCAAIAPGTVDTGLYKDWDSRLVLEKPDEAVITCLMVVPPALPV